MANVERPFVGATEPNANVPDSELTREEIIARNMRVVEAHFHNETPETIEKAITLYADTITWEAPTRSLCSMTRFTTSRSLARRCQTSRIPRERTFRCDPLLYSKSILNSV